MNVSRHQRLTQLFGELCEQTPAERCLRLDVLMREDHELAGDVASLLAHSDSPMIDLDDADQLSTIIGELSASLARELPHPARIDDYDILEQLGQGGMGVVYLAQQQQPLERKVALKVIRPGMGSPQVLTRFDMERRTLAAMNHPGIAAVHDAGATDDGRPYFVMQHVAGERITTFCDDRRLTIDKRLELFEKVCDAVAHAHQKGVIHRDLKPSNILVEQRDGRALPKVIDFGVAKAMGDGLGEESLHTAPGQLLGTPQYMSPEQTELGGLHVDTRSDVFSLGALLYELLCGTTPIDAETVRNTSFDQLCRMIRENEAVAPSRRIQQMEPEDAATAADRRGTTPNELTRSLRHELEWIVLKALENEPARRYPSVAALASDIARYRRHEPVSAGSPGLAYRTRKFMRRHRGALAGAAAVALALCAGLGAVLVQRIETAREAENNAHIVKFIETLLSSADPRNAQGDDTTLRDFMDDAGAQLQDNSTLPREVTAALHNTIGATYGGLGDYAQAEAHFHNAHDQWLTLHGPNDARTLRAAANLVHIYDLQKRHQEAYDLGRVNLERAETALEPHQRETRMLTTNVAIAAEKLGRDAEAEQLYRLAVDRCRVVRDEEPDYYENSLANLGVFLVHHDQFDQGALLLEEAYAIAQKTYGENHPGTLVAMSNIAMVRSRQQQNEAARDLYEEIVQRSRSVLGRMHPLTIDRVRNLGIARLKLSRFSEAEHLLAPVYAEAVEVLGYDSAESIGLAEILVTAIAYQNRIEDAEAICLEHFTRVADELGEADPLTRRAARFVAELYDTWQKPELYREWMARAGAAPQPQ